MKFTYKFYLKNLSEADSILLLFQTKVPVTKNVDDNSFILTISLKNKRNICSYLQTDSVHFYSWRSEELQMKENNFYGNKWTYEEFGPYFIPSKGSTIKLTKENFNIYKTIIAVHEGCLIENKGDAFICNNTTITDYSFKKNYYFVLGDNRSSSKDSRTFGPIPKEGIIGKVVLVF